MNAIIFAKFAQSAEKPSESMYFLYSIGLHFVAQCKHYRIKLVIPEHLL